jgi:uncharacterized protein YjbJ (UPF0337 family)
MDRDRMEGKGKKITGAVREKLGDLTGNRSEQAKGKVQKNMGKVEETYGRVKDEIRAERDRRDHPDAL